MPTIVPGVRALTTRAFLAGAAIVALVLVLTFALLARSARRSGDAAVQRELEQSADLVAQFLSGRQRSLAGGARVFVQGPYFRAIVGGHRRDDILDQTFEAAEQLGADWVFIVDDRGTLLAKSDEPGASGGDMSSVPLVAGALQGRMTTGFGVSRDSLLFQAVAVPIAVPGGAPLGALVATKLVDAPLARDVKAATSSEIVFFVRDTGGPRIAATSFAAPLGERLSAEVTEHPRAHAVIAGTRYATQGAAVATAGGDIVGGYVVLSARDAASAEIADVRRAVLLAGAAGLVLAWLAAAGVRARVARPLAVLTAEARRAVRGNEGTAEPMPAPAARVDDEVDALRGAVHELVTDLHDRQALATAVGAAFPEVARLGAAATAESGLTMQRVQGATARSGPARAMRLATGTREPRSGDELQTGDLVAGRYVLEAMLGTGELGTTYRARDRVAARTVALKRFREARVGGDASAFVAALREELRETRRMAHRNVVRVHDAGEDAGVAFVTMDYVDGISLAALLEASGSLDDEAVVAIARQLCRALAAAESCGVVHGSLAPRQILLGHDGVLRVGDFALARVERSARGGVRSLRDAQGGAVPQLAGATVGTPEYMAPEQLIGEAATARADLYAAGVVLYECVTGRTPFRTDSPLAFLAQKLGGSEGAGDAAALPATRPSRAGTPAVLAELIARMIAPEPERRAGSARELLALLDRLP
ncbi:MAG TPA: protein kinase [Gemmatimonadaceae bacterium]|nr:protein kinase [Gemmatimonadaceae bacterium]